MARERLLTANELAERLRLSAYHVRRLARERKIPCMKNPHGQLRFDWRAVRMALRIPKE